MTNPRTYKITKKPVTDVTCPVCKKGILFRQDLSRLEEGLGHEGFACDLCDHAVKYVDPNRD